MSLKAKTLPRCPFKSLVPTGGGVDDFWTLSGQGTNEYYYNQTDLPTKPLNVQENGANIPEGTIMSLTAGQWAWNRSDGQAANTLYIRLADDADPDSKDLDYVKCSEPINVFQASAGIETIAIGVMICNNEDVGVDANVILLVTDSANNAKYTEMFTAQASDGPLKDGTKMIFAAEDKLKIMTDKEYVSVLVSENEG